LVCPEWLESWLYRDSVQGESKMVVIRDPERSVLKVREHWKDGEPPFAGRHGLNLDTT
jgi:hypothetical protein